MNGVVAIGIKVLWGNPKVKYPRLTVSVHGNDELTPGNHLLAIQWVSEGRCISGPLTPKKQIGHNPIESGCSGYWIPITRNPRKPGRPGLPQPH